MGGLVTASVAMKPLATLNRPTLHTVDVATKEDALSFRERTDVTAVPAMGVVAETMVAIVLAAESLRKFGGDSLAEFLRNHAGFIALDRRDALGGLEADHSDAWIRKIDGPRRRRRGVAPLGVRCRGSPSRGVPRRDHDDRAGGPLPPVRPSAALQGRCSQGSGGPIVAACESQTISEPPCASESSTVN